MRASPLWALLATLTAFAGCFGGGGDDDGGGPSTDRELSAAHPFGIFLCDDGLRTADDAAGGLDDCNHRVTKPLLDPTWFNWTAQHGPANEVSIGVNPTNPLNVVGGAKDYTVSYISHDLRCDSDPSYPGGYTVWMGTYWSDDGGVTWENDLMPGFFGDGRPSPLKGNWCNTDPVVVFDDDGTAFFSGLNYDGERSDFGLGVTNPLYPEAPHDLLSGSQLYVARSDDGGAHYTDFGIMGNGDDGAVFNDKQWFAAQPAGNHMVMTWSQFYTAPPMPGLSPESIALIAAQGTDAILFAESMDAGATWTPQRFFTPGNGLYVDAQFSMPQYLPGGQSVAVIWATDDVERVPGHQLPATHHLSYTEGILTPLGLVFQPILSGFEMNPIDSAPDRDGTGPSQFRVSTYPVLAVDTSGGEHDGRRYVVWGDQPGPIDSDVEVLLRWSDDGMTWSEPVTVNDVAAGDQYIPWIDVDPLGGVHVVWYDRRNDPTNELLDVYYAYSGDGGATFHPNVRVSETNFNGDLGHHQGGFPFIGDYIGVDADAYAAHLIWSDTRHTGEAGRLAGSDVYSATLVRDAEAGMVFPAAQ
ncbi:MAG TPA: sialidase family protein [Candidatus Thermoplasmatota archaeon]|nr:sialidase family protein [Candidatus Thermoplasmatota archaeon]